MQIARIVHDLSFTEVTRLYEEIIKQNPELQAAMGLLDRFFLLTVVLRRRDLLHPWLYARCREVEAAPDGHLDLWSREHYKSSIITQAGAIQELLRDPEQRICIFSFNRPIAKAFLRQIKHEFENNILLKGLYPDVCWGAPKREAPKWSEDEGIILRRRGNYREASIESWGLVDGQPTSRHFTLRIYDDVVTDSSVTTPEMVEKTTRALELSDNLGVAHGGRAWYIGTRYTLADTYQTLLDRGALIPRIYPATDNGRPDGKPVFWDQETWDKKKRAQPSQVAAQLLQNPAAGQEAMFRAEWLKPYEFRPRTLNVYILCDPSLGKTHRSDRTAIAVIGVDAGRNKYLLDGYRQRMRLPDRWRAIKTLFRHWADQPGVVNVRVGYERYGMQTDIEHFEEMMKIERISIPIDEVGWPREGTHSKEDRVERLVPDFQYGNFFLPACVWDPAGMCHWHVHGDKLSYRKLAGETNVEKRMKRMGQGHLLARPIRRADENGRIYDLTRAFIEEYQYFPFGTYKDLIDAVSRVYDMEPAPPMIVRREMLEPEAFPD